MVAVVVVSARALNRDLLLASTSPAPHPAPHSPSAPQVSSSALPVVPLLLLAATRASADLAGSTNPDARVAGLSVSVYVSAQPVAKEDHDTYTSTLFNATSAGSCCNHADVCARSVEEAEDTQTPACTTSPFTLPYLPLMTNSMRHKYGNAAFPTAPSCAWPPMAQVDRCADVCGNLAGTTKLKA